MQIRHCEFAATYRMGARGLNTKVPPNCWTLCYFHAAAVIILGFLDSSTFYCSSRDYLDATLEETVYCVFVSEYRA